MAYLIPLLIGAVGIFGIWQSSSVWWLSYLAVLVIFILHPIFDFIFVGLSISVVQGWQKKISEILLRLSFPMVVILMALSLFRLHEIFLAQASSGTSSGFELPWLQVIGIILSTGVLMGLLGINTAHELVHRDSIVDRFFGVCTLALVNFSHFRINHVEVHHRWVATPRDPATARAGESLYAFWVRSYFVGWVRAWQFESARLQGLGFSGGLQFLFRHRVIQYVFFSLIGSFLLGMWGGLSLLLGWYAISAFAILLLQTVDYVEHYGLLRKELKPGVFEAVKPKHSWDSYTYFTNAALFNLGLHSHHHTRSQLSFTDLRAGTEARILPYGYSVMFLCALVPPVWRRVVGVG